MASSIDSQVCVGDLRGAGRRNLRGSATLVVAVIASFASAQDAAGGDAGGGSGGAIVWILGLLLLVAVGAIVALAMRNNSAPTTTARPVHDEEGTQVRGVESDRLVRLTGGVAVGSEIPVISVVTIGRDKSCTVSLSDPEMSGLHAEVRKERGKAYVVDKGSTNGTFLNDDRLDAEDMRPLNDGDKIKLGNTTLLFKAQS